MSGLINFPESLVFGMQGCDFSGRIGRNEYKGTIERTGVRGTSVQLYPFPEGGPPFEFDTSWGTWEQDGTTIILDVGVFGIYTISNVRV